MTKIAIIGAGLSGLFSGWLLKKNNIDFVIIEQEDYVGGLARSFNWHGYDCDFATHRLFTADEKVLKELLQITPMGRHVRRSKIFLRGKWLRDPLDVIELFTHLPLKDQLHILHSYLFRPRNLPINNFENFVIHIYGRGLYQYFFQPYTEKLFGISGEEISRTWAKMKVRIANPFDLIRESTKTKFQYFYYPVTGGYGAIAEQLYRKIINHVKLNSRIIELKEDHQLIKKVRYEQNGTIHEEKVDAVISTIPVTIIANLLGYHVNLRFQKADALYLQMNLSQITDNHWIYFIDKDVAINRMVEFRNLSSQYANNKQTVICLEVTQHNQDIPGDVISDLEKVGLINKKNILDTLIIRENFSYPIYDINYEKTILDVNNFFNSYENLHLLGRSAEFKHRETDDIFVAASELVSKIKNQMEIKNNIPLSELEITDLHQIDNPKIFAVILTWNNYQDTRECLNSINRIENADIEIVLVDNGSVDDTPQKIKAEFPDVHIIENGQNIGVPAGYNVGFRHALKENADYILMLNNDTILHSQMLENLLRIAKEDENSGILMPKILFHGTSNQVWSSGGRYRKFPPAILMTDKRKKIGDTLRLIEYAPSCVLLIHKKAFLKVGLFDPGYFFYYDDWDFSERVRAHGLNIWYVPDAIAWHKVSRSTKGTTSPLYWRTMAESSVRFYRRHGRPVWFSILIHIGYLIFREFFWKRNWEYWKYFYKGLLDGFQKPLGSLSINENL